MPDALCPENLTPLSSPVSEVNQNPIGNPLPPEKMANLEADREELRCQSHRRACQKWSAKNKEYLRHRSKLRWKNDREKQRERHREWRLRNSQKRRASASRYRKNHPDRVKAALKSWYEKNHEYVVECGKRRYAKLKDDPEYKSERKLYHAQLYLEQKSAITERVKKWRSENADKVRAIARRYAKRHPEAGRARNAKRRARKKGAHIGDNRVDALIREWRSKDRFQCYYCGNKFGVKRLQIDHKIPISKGGEHSVENICRSCPSCNARKHDKPINGFRGQLLLIQ